MIYKIMYGLDNADTVFRGTLRYPGWCRIISKISKLGYLDDTERPELKGKTYAEIMAMLINYNSGNLQKYTAEYLGVSNNSEEIKKLEWLGLFGNDSVNANPPTYLDILTKRMLEKMSYENGERDMIILQHDFLAEYPKGRKEHITSLMIDYGIPNGETAMARTVSLPAAIAAKLILEDKIKIKGVRIPVFAEIYKPVLAELESMNIIMVETVKELRKEEKE
ncbi:saccharopine dehydrogenase [bacterium BMS3Abin04]|nr:saccharopine dehydrogenase [bacterium BMS3Abin04]